MDMGDFQTFVAQNFAFLENIRDHKIHNSVHKCTLMEIWYKYYCDMMPESWNSEVRANANCQPTAG
jgi:hypothetical protein